MVSEAVGVTSSDLRARAMKAIPAASTQTSDSLRPASISRVAGGRGSGTSRGRTTPIICWVKAPRDRRNYPIRAVERVCDVLDGLQQSPQGASFSTVAHKTGLPKSSAYRYLSALEVRRYVERDEQGMYSLGFAFRPSHIREIDTLVECARDKLERLRDQTGETTNLGVLDGMSVVHALVIESMQMMRLAARPGDRGPLHATALGKAIAAKLTAERVRSILEAAGTERLTGRTITSVDDFLYELERVRRQSYGVDDCENQPDGRCVAVALEGMPFLCGISVSAPASRLTAEDVAEVAGLLANTAAEVTAEYIARTTRPW